MEGAQPGEAHDGPPFVARSSQSRLPRLGQRLGKAGEDCIIDHRARDAIITISAFLGRRLSWKICAHIRRYAASARRASQQKGDHQRHSAFSPAWANRPPLLYTEAEKDQA